MPYGEYRVRCMHCGTFYTSGDCITHTCDDCSEKGHGGVSIDCTICSREAAERRARIDAAIAAKQRGD